MRGSSHRLCVRAPRRRSAPPDCAHVRRRSTWTASARRAGPLPIAAESSNARGCATRLDARHPTAQTGRAASLVLHTHGLPDGDALPATRCRSAGAVQHTAQAALSECLSRTSLTCCLGVCVCAACVRARDMREWNMCVAFYAGCQNKHDAYRSGRLKVRFTLFTWIMLQWTYGLDHKPCRAATERDTECTHMSN